MIKILVIACVICVVASTPAALNGACECSAFASDKPDKDNLLIHQTTKVESPCDANGADTCKNLCLMMGQLAKKEAPARLCDAVKDNPKFAKSSITPSLFSRACDSQEWQFTGLSSTKPICCDNGLPQSCPGE